jgi:rhodanese-related sulfurtransferase
VQATDTFMATRGARVVLVDDTGVRATMTASWLAQMGWEDVYVLQDGLSGAALEDGPHRPRIPGLDAIFCDLIGPDELSAALTGGAAAVLDLATSVEYKKSHIPGAWWGLRERIGTALAKLPPGVPVTLASPDGVLACLTAPAAAALARAPVRVLHGGTDAWRAKGLPVSAGPEKMADAPDDVWLRPYDREQGQEAAMKEYLGWEVNVMRQIEQDGDAKFRAFPRP